MTSEGFQGYPEKHVFAAFSSREQAARALDDVRQSGVPEADLAIYSGEQGADNLDADGTTHGLGSVLVRSVQLLVADGDRLGDYQEVVEEGGVVIAAKAEDDERKQLLSAVFNRNEGRSIRYFGSMTVEDLSVDPSRTRMD
jgi:hypothetical protein